MSFDTLCRTLCDRALADGRNTLLESELYELLRAGGLNVPDYVTLEQPGAYKPITGDRVVVKVVSPVITHKTEVGGVLTTVNNPEAIVKAFSEVLTNVARSCGDEMAKTVRHVMVASFVHGIEGLGGQVFAGLRHSEEMGPVVAIGFGGLDTEELSKRFKKGEAMMVFSPLLVDVDQAFEKFRKTYVYRRIVGLTREHKKFASDEAILRILRFFERLAKFSNTPEFGFTILDFEVNPFIATGEDLIAVDAFMRFRKGVSDEPRQRKQVETMLKPRTAVIVGASNKGVNPGRIILRNLLREGFAVDAIRAIHPDASEIDGVKCCRAINELPWTADLMVIAVNARQVPDVMNQVLCTNAARSIILIPGGMDETEEGKETVRKLREAIDHACASKGLAPTICGPNCLGIRSRPGKYDTLFIPESKLPLPEGDLGNCALVCQSGAYMITRMDNLPFLDPRYAISTGNQMDLTLVDFVETIVKDEAVEVIGVYVEGFKPLDGLRLGRIIRDNRDKDFIVYKAGRTTEGLSATASHTASISGDYESCVEVLKDAHALIAETFEEFNILLAMSTLLRKKEVYGLRLAAISNAGFESVGMADNVLPGTTLPQPGKATAERLRETLRAAKLDTLVNIRNPIDLTPMASDEVYIEVIKAFLDDPQVDAAIVGVIPLTPAMKTLPPGLDAHDSIASTSALPQLLPPLFKSSVKPIVVTVDAGKLYDPLARSLMASGIPCFRSVDKAMRVFQKYIRHRLKC